MTAEMDELDRKVGRPVASYSLEDLRRMFLRGQAVPEAMPGAMPATVQAMVPSASDALAGPALPGPVTAAPLPPPAAPRVTLPAGTRPVMPPPPAPAAMGGGMPFETQLDQRMLSVDLSPADRARAQQLAAALSRQPPTGTEAVSPGYEMQMMPERLRGMPPEAQADQTMRSVSVINPNAFGQRFRRTMRGE